VAHTLHLDAPTLPEVWTPVALRTVASVVDRQPLSLFCLAMSSGRRGRPVKSSQTCDVCKLRHQRCDSSRPSCQYCALRDLECVYSRTPAHKITGSSVRRRGANPRPRFTEPADKDLPCLNAAQRPGSMSSPEGGDLVLLSLPAYHPLICFD
jgi:hypothetical protein